MTWTAKRLGIPSTDRARWLEARRSGIGASDMAAVMGVDEYAGPLHVYESKVGAPPDTGSEKAQWGLIFEEPILLEYGRRTDRQVKPAGELLQSADDPTWLATLDGEQTGHEPRGASGVGVAEIKTSGMASRWKEDLPLRIQIQQQWQLMVTGAEWSTCVWLPFPERELGWLDVLRHPAFIGRMQEEAREFWRRVELRDPPPPNALDSARKVLARLYPNLDDTPLALQPSTDLDPMWLADELEAIREAMGELKARETSIRNIMAATLGDARHGLLPDGRYWSQSDVKPRIDQCPHCDEVLREVDGFRSLRLNQPRKAPFGTSVPREMRPAPDLVTRLRQSLEALELER